MNNLYQPTKQSDWQGRIDSHSDFDAFRWHQWIKCINITEDQEPSKDILGIAIIGFCCDLGVQLNKGRPGANNGPFQIRKELMNLPCHFTEDLKLYDAGNIVATDNLQEAQDALSQAIDRLLSLNLFPIVLGGGHEVALGNYNGIRRSKSNIGIVNFDAHFDLRPSENKGSSGTMFDQIAQESEKRQDPFDYFCVGIQQRGNTKSLFKRAKALEVDYILAREVTQENLVNIFMKLDRFMKSKDHIYVTICMDVFASAFAPGVSSAQPLGLQPWHLLTILKYIIRSNKVISFDLAEVSPRFDQDNITANLASTVVFHAVQQLAELDDLDFNDIF